METLRLFFLFASFLASVQLAATWTPAATPKTSLLAAEALAKLTAYYAAHPTQDNCTLENVAVRKEWYAHIYKGRRLKYR